MNIKKIISLIAILLILIFAFSACGMFGGSKRRATYFTGAPEEIVKGDDCIEINNVVISESVLVNRCP